jgi:hypothetical protein
MKMQQQRHGHIMPRFIILLSTLFFLASISSALAQNPTQQREITLAPATPVDNYQVEITLTTSNFDYSKTLTNGADIRFYDANGTKLSYWIETWNPSGNSVLWAKVAKSGSSLIYLFYGSLEPDVISEANGDTTFELFDDFGDAAASAQKWNIPTGWSVANGWMRKTNPANVGDVVWKNVTFTDISAKMRLKSPNVAGNNDRGFLARRVNATTSCDVRAYLLGMGYWAHVLDIGICGAGGSCPSLASSTAYTYQADAWYTLRMSVGGTALAVECLEKSTKLTAANSELKSGYFGMCGCWSDGTAYDVDYIFGYKYAVSESKTTLGLEKVVDDKDKDKVPDLIDNCPDLPNPEQSDRDLDTLGDPCDCAPENNLEPGVDGACPNCGALGTIQPLGGSRLPLLGLGLMMVFGGWAFFRRMGR